MDVSVPRAIPEALRRRGYDVLTAQEDGAALLDDATLLDRVGIVRRMIFTMDADFVDAATRRSRLGQSFATVIYIAQKKATIRRCVEDLALITETIGEDEAMGNILWLPL